MLANILKFIALTFAFAFVLAFLGLGSGLIAYATLALGDVVAMIGG